MFFRASPPSQVISDLLKPDATNLVVREDRRRGVHVEGLSEWVVRSPAEVYSLMQRGAAARTTGVRHWEVFGMPCWMCSLLTGAQ